MGLADKFIPKVAKGFSIADESFTNQDSNWAIMLDGKPFPWYTKRKSIKVEPVLKDDGRQVPYAKWVTVTILVNEPVGNVPDKYYQGNDSTVSVIVIPDGE